MPVELDVLDQYAAEFESQRDAGSGTLDQYAAEFEAQQAQQQELDQRETKPAIPGQAPGFFQRAIEFGDAEQKSRWSQTIDDIRRSGVHHGNYLKAAAMEIEMKQAQRRREGGKPLHERQQEAIQDRWKIDAIARVAQSLPEDQRDNYALTEARRLRVSQFTPSMVERRFEQERGRVEEGGAEGLLARLRREGNRATKMLGATITGPMGLVAPKTAARLQDELNATLPTVPEEPGAAGLLRRLPTTLAVEGPKMASMAGVLGPAGTAATFAASGAGSERADIARAREGGAEISGAQEAVAATGVGGVEGLSGFISAKLFGSIGKTLSKKAAAEGMSKAAMKAMLEKAGKLFADFSLEFGEEAAANLTADFISQQVYDPDRRLDWEAAGEAGLVGGIVAGGAGSRFSQDPAMQSQGDGAAKAIERALAQKGAIEQEPQEAGEQPGKQSDKQPDKDAALGQHIAQGVAAMVERGETVTPEAVAGLTAEFRQSQAETEAETETEPEPVTPKAKAKPKTEAKPKAEPGPELPQHLRGAKPRYNIGPKQYEPEFESDVDKALFITSQKKKSKRDEEYRQFLRDEGFTDAEITALGGGIRGTIKLQAQASEPGPITIPDQRHQPAAKTSGKTRPRAEQPVSKKKAKAVSPEKRPGTLASEITGELTATQDGEPAWGEPVEKGKAVVVKQFGQPPKLGEYVGDAGDYLRVKYPGDDAEYTVSREDAAPARPSAKKGPTIASKAPEVPAARTPKKTQTQQEEEVAGETEPALPRNVARLRKIAKDRGLDVSDIKGPGSADRITARLQEQEAEVVEVEEDAGLPEATRRQIEEIEQPTEAVADTIAGDAMRIIEQEAEAEEAGSEPAAVTQARASRAATKAFGGKVVPEENQSDQTKQAVGLVKRLGKRAVVIDTEFPMAGVYMRADDVVVINARVADGRTAVAEAVVHEAMHATGLDKTSGLKEKATIKKWGRRYLELVERSHGKAAADDLRDNPDVLAQEAVAYYAGKLATDSKVRRQLLNESDPGFLQRVVDAVRSMANKFTGRGRDIDLILGELQAVMDSVEGQLPETAKSAGEARTRKAFAIKREIEEDAPLAPGEGEGLTRSQRSRAKQAAKKETDQLVARHKYKGAEVSPEAATLFNNELMRTHTTESAAMLKDVRENERQYIERAQGGDVSAETALIAAHLGRMRQLAARHAGARKHLIDDMVGEAIRAAQQWMHGRPLKYPRDTWKAIGKPTNLTDFDTVAFDSVWAGLAQPISSAMTKEFQRQVGGSRPEAEGALETSLEGAKGVEPVTGQRGLGEKVDQLQVLAKQYEAEGRSRAELVDHLAKMADTDAETIENNLGHLFLPAPSPKKVKRRLGKVMQEKPKTTGRPELANIGETETQRRLLDTIDSFMEDHNIPTKETKAQWKREGAAIYADPARRREVETIMDAGTQFATPGQTRAAKLIWDERAEQAMSTGDKVEWINTIEGAWGYRMGRTQTARVLASGYDDVKTKSQRLREYAFGAITTPPPGLSHKIKRAKDKAARRGETLSGEALADAVPGLAEYAKDVQEMFDRWRKQGLDVLAIDEELAANPMWQYKIVRDVMIVQSRHTGWWDPFQEFFRNALMSHPKTYIRNVLGAAHAVTDIFMVQPIRGLLADITRSGDTSFAASIAGMQAALNPTVWARAIRSGALSMVYEAPIFDIEKLGGKVTDLEYNRPIAITGVSTRRMLARFGAPTLGKAAGVGVAGTGRLVRVPQTLNMGVDQFVKTIHAHSVVAREAAQLGKRAGYKGMKLYAFVDEQLADVGSDAWSAAIASGETNRVVFQAEAGPIEAALIKARDTVPPLGLVLPFIKTPSQLFKESWWLTPGLGTGTFAGKAALSAMGWKGGFKSKQEVTTRASQQIMGMMALALMWKAAGGDDEEGEEPIITGAPSYHRSARQERLSKEAVLPPYTIKIGDTRYSYRNIEPYSILFGSLASMVDEVRRYRRGVQGAGETASRLFQRLRATYMDLPALKAVGDLVKVAEDPEYYGNRALLTIGAGWMPNAVRGTARSKDDLVRSYRPTGTEEERPGMGMQLWRQMNPHGDHMPPPKVTVFGSPVRKDELQHHGGFSTAFVHRMLAPFSQRAVVTGTEGKILKMVLRFNETHPPKEGQTEAWFIEPPRTVQFKIRGSLRPVREEMNEDEWDLFMRLSGRIALRAAREQDWNYANPDERDIERLARIMEKSRGTVRKHMTAARQVKYLGRQDDYERIIENLKRSLDEIESNMGISPQTQGAPR